MLHPGRLLVVLAGILAGARGWAADGGVTVVSPVAGWASSDVRYDIPNDPADHSLRESAPLYGLYLMYADRTWSLGNLGHYSVLEHSRENSYMAFAYYTFLPGQAYRPVLGMTLDYIGLDIELPTADIAPMTAMDMSMGVWAFHPTAGVAMGNDLLTAVPFVGYFHETVGFVLSSPGMRIGTGLRNGFRTQVEEKLDYGSVGVQLKSVLSHLAGFDRKACILDAKMYVRMRQGEGPLLTVRSRLDIFLSRSFGISAKADYFRDSVQTNTFVMAGPDFVF